LDHALDPNHHLTVEDVANEIIASGAGTEWEAMMNHPECKQQLIHTLTNHFATSMDIERGWFKNTGIVQGAK
jgi:hypothetical protein